MKEGDKDNRKILEEDGKQEQMAAEKSFNQKQLAFKTEHLRGHIELDSVLQVLGEKYMPLKKLVWYQLHGVMLKEKIILLGKIYEDTRLHTLIAMKSGKAKHNFKTISRDIVRATGGSVEEPTSYHPEQFVGKTIEREVEVSGGKKGKKEKVFIPNLGFLNNDFLPLDEALLLFTSTQDGFKQTRTYLRLGADPYKRNEISKRSVNNLPNEAINFCPPVSYQFFLQPGMLPESVVLTGDLRRYIPMYVNLDFEDRYDMYGQRLVSSSGTELQKEVLVKHLVSVKKLDGNWEFTEDAKQLLEKLHKELIFQGQVHSKKSYHYTFIKDTALQNFLIKLSCILAGSSYTTTVNSTHVLLAYADLAEFFQLELEYVNSKVKGSFDYGEEWQGAEGKDVQCLKYLYDNGALSKEASNISIVVFENIISTVFGVKGDAAIYHYRRFKKEGLIKSDKEGSYGSKVWLAFIPKFKNFELIQNVRGFAAYESVIIDYDKLCSQLVSEAFEGTIRSFEGEIVGLNWNDKETVLHNCIECKKSEPCKFLDNKPVCKLHYIIVNEDMGLFKAWVGNEWVIGIIRKDEDVKTISAVNKTVQLRRTVLMSSIMEGY